MWRWILAIAGVAVIAGGGYGVMRNARNVDTASARREAIASYLDERARTRLPRTWQVTMPIDGRILPIDLVEGSRVQAGEVVARIEPADLDTAVAIAEARVRRLEASIVENNDTRLEESTLVELDSFLESVVRAVEASRTQTEASEAREAYRTFDLGRKRLAHEDDAASLKEVEEAELAEIEARVDYRTDVLALRALEAMYRAVQIWPLQVRQVIEKKGLTEAVLAQEAAEARAALDQARRDRERGAITSPVDGVVLRRVVTSRQALPAGELLLEIGRLQDLEIEVEVLSQEAVAVRVGDPVQVVIPALAHEPLAGAVRRIEPRGFTKVSSLGVEQQRVLVIVAFDPDSLQAFRNEGYSLGVGYRLRVRIFTDRREDTIVVPRSALFRGRGDQWQVFAVRGGRARLVDVQIGLLNDLEAELLSGINADEPVIVAPDTDLSDGDRVRSR